MFKRQESLDHRVQQALRVAAEAVDSLSLIAQVLDCFALIAQFLESLALIAQFLDPFQAKLGAYPLKSSSN